MMTGILYFCSWSLGPIPECSRILGLSRAPADRTTSFDAKSGNSVVSQCLGIWRMSQDKTYMSFR